MARDSPVRLLERSFMREESMGASFGVLANGHMLLADHSSHWNWTESAVNLAVVGAAWVVADSLVAAKAREHSRLTV